MFFIYVEIEMFCAEHSGLRDFIILCHRHEHKRLAETRVEGTVIKCIILNKVLLTSILQPNLIIMTLVKFKGNW
jgi:hypothetical protein